MLLFTASMHTRCKSFGALAHHRSAHCVVLRHLFATFSSLRENLPGALASKELGFLCDDDQVSLSEWVVVGVFGAERRAIVQERGRNTQHCAVNSVDEDRIAQCTSVMLTQNVDEMWLLQCRQQELLWHVMTSLSLVEDIMGHTQTRLIRLPSPMSNANISYGSFLSCPQRSQQTALTSTAYVPTGSAAARSRVVRCYVSANACERAYSRSSAVGSMSYRVHPIEHA